MEYSKQCTEEELSGWTTQVNDHDVEEERFEIYSKESIKLMSLELPNMHLNSCMYVNNWLAISLDFVTISTLHFII